MSDATVVVRTGPEIIEALNVVRGTAASLAHVTQRHGEDSEQARVARMVYRQACEALAALLLAAAVVDATDANGPQPFAPIETERDWRDAQVAYMAYRYGRGDHLGYDADKDEYYDAQGELLQAWETLPPQSRGYWCFVARSVRHDVLWGVEARVARDSEQDDATDGQA